MNLLRLLGDFRRAAALVVLVLAVLVLGLAGIARWRSMENPTRGPSPPSAARMTPSPAPVSPSVAASPAPAQDTAVAFCRQYFASSWQESAAQEQARVAPYLTPRELAGWRARLTPVEIARHETSNVSGCTATVEGMASGAQLGFFLDAQVVTSSTDGMQTRTAAAEIFLVAVPGAWKVEQVRS